jgi:hypothetical protein
VGAVPGATWVQWPGRTVTLPRPFETITVPVTTETVVVPGGNVLVVSRSFRGANVGDRGVMKTSKTVPTAAATAVAVITRCRVPGASVIAASPRVRFVTVGERRTRSVY